MLVAAARSTLDGVIKEARDSRSGSKVALRTSGISPSAMVDLFFDDCYSRGRSLGSVDELDACLAVFVEELEFDGTPLGDAEQLWLAVAFARELTVAQLPATQVVIADRYGRADRDSDAILTFESVCSLAAQLSRVPDRNGIRGFGPLMAALALLPFDVPARPSSLVALKSDDIIWPGQDLGGVSDCWRISTFAHCWFDEAVPVGTSGARELFTIGARFPFIGDIFSEVVLLREDQENIFPFTCSEVQTTFADAAVRCDITAPHVSMNTICLGGASQGVLTHLLRFLAIQLRDLRRDPSLASPPAMPPDSGGPCRKQV